MKILLVSQHFWPENFIINDVAKYLNKKNKIFIYTGQPNYPLGKIKKKYRKFFFKKNLYYNIPIFRVPIFPRKDGKSFQLILNYFSFIFFGIFFSKKLITNIKKIDLILVYGTSPIIQSFVAIFLKFLTKAKLVIWVQDLWPIVLKDTGHIKSKFILNIVNFFIKFIYSKADLLLAQSYEFCEFIKKNYKINKIIIHENPGRSVNIKLIKNKGKKIFLFTGNIGHAQSIHSLVEVAKKIQPNDNFIIKIIGGGSRYSWLLKQIKKFKLEKKIITTGNVAYQKLPKFYEEATALLILLSKGEGLEKTIPNKFQNYLSVGKPILCYGSGAVNNKLNRYKLGFPINNRNHEIFYQKLKKVSKLSDKKIKTFYDRNINFFKKNYMLSKNVEKLDKILKSLC